MLISRSTLSGQRSFTRLLGNVCVEKGIPGHKGMCLFRHDCVPLPGSKRLVFVSPMIVGVGRREG